MAHLQKKLRQADPLKRGGSPESKITKEQIIQEEYKVFTMLVIFYVKHILSQHCIDLTFLCKPSVMYVLFDSRPINK